MPCNTAYAYRLSRFTFQDSSETVGRQPCTCSRQTHAAAMYMQHANTSVPAIPIATVHMKAKVTEWRKYPARLLLRLPLPHLAFAFTTASCSMEVKALDMAIKREGI